LQKRENSRANFPDKKYNFGEKTFFYIFCEKPKIIKRILMKLKSSLIFLFALTMFTAWAQPQIQLQVFASGLTKPVDIVHTSDDRLFIVEKDGFIRIINSNGQVLPTPFLNIDARVNSTSSERGLLGLAFHPDYAQNGYFFVNYTNNSGNTRISRFTVSPSDPNQADPNSEKILLEVSQPFSNHNGGDLVFGPDGMLYIGLGDGGSADDPGDRGQNRLTLLGKMLRIDVDNGDPYAIPEDNPFAFDDFTLDEIWALGLRNPWRFSFDRLTGDLWIADVGQDDWEEINMQPADSPGGENYGWRCYEGNHAFITTDCNVASEYTFPVYEYAHAASGCSGSVTGGFVYRGSQFPTMYGHYFYADYCNGRFWSLIPDGQGGWTNILHFDGANNDYVSFGENSAGELFLAGYNSGNIYQIADLCGALSINVGFEDETCAGDADGSIDLTIVNAAPPISVTWSNGQTTEDIEGLSAGVYTATISDANDCETNVTVVLANSTPDAPEITADGNLLQAPAGFASYQWFLDGEIIEGASSFTYNATISGSYTVEVTNEAGCSALSEPYPVIVDATIETLGIHRLSVSPNPFTDAFNLEMLVDRQGTFSFSIFNAGGQIIWQKRETISGIYRVEIPARQWAAGMYLLKVEREGKEITRKIQKK
jgi:glucose/arabinose dehydrogenase